MNTPKGKYSASFSTSALNKSSFGTQLFFNLAAFCIMISFFMIIIWQATEISEPLVHVANLHSISLDPSNLIMYSFQTLFRMMIAVVISVIFALIYAVIAAKNKYAQQILIPLLDVMQSVPILGYMSFTVTWFISMFPGNILGAELAAIFAIFTSQVWNMIFSLYQSFKTVPKEFIEVAHLLKFSAWQRFWKVEVPYAIPSLVWNISISIASGWFFVVAAESIKVGDYSLDLPGIGSYIALAVKEKDITSILYALCAMIIVVILYDKIITKPLIIWSDKFRQDIDSVSHRPKSLVLNIFQRSIWSQKIVRFLNHITSYIVNISIFRYTKPVAFKKNISTTNSPQYFQYIWYFILSVMMIFCTYNLINFLDDVIGWQELLTVLKYAIYTTIRVFVAIIISSIIWVPIGVYIGLNPRLSAMAAPIVQFLASFPANLIFPIFVILITKYDLEPDIWLTLLMVMGTQWYILFNVISGAASLPSELKETTSVFRIKGLLWWRKVMLPALIPSYITGAVTASGGAWNASIVAEIVNFGDTTIMACGLGSYIAEMTAKADFHRIALGITIMCLFVVGINRIFWQPLHNYTNKKFQL